MKAYDGRSSLEVRSGLSKEGTTSTRHEELTGVGKVESVVKSAVGKSIFKRLERGNEICPVSSPRAKWKQWVVRLER